MQRPIPMSPADGAIHLPRQADGPHSSTPAGDVHSSRISRLRSRAVVAPFVLLLICWLWLFSAERPFEGGPSGNSFGADFAMFVGAARVLQSGGNPYDHNALYQTESTMMRRQRLSMTGKKPVVRVGNPPLFLWSLQPLTHFPFQTVALAWMLALLVLSAAGFVAALSYAGWNRRVLPCLIFLLMPQTILGVFYGNVICLVFAAVAFAMALVKRHPFLAGALLGVAWLKPPVALPVALLIWLFHTPSRSRTAAGFATASACALALTLLTTGWHSLILWLHGLVEYSRDMAIQPDVASLAGLYVRWAPSSTRLALEMAGLAVALVVTGLCWWKLRHAQEVPLLAVGWLWFVWFLATPYAHFFDEMLLALPMLALLGRNGALVARPLPALALYLAFFSLLLNSVTPFDAYLLPLPLLGIGACLLRVSRVWANVAILAFPGLDTSRPPSPIP